MRVVVIGFGIGGFLIVGFLVRKGYDVMVFEKVFYIGGCFINLNYKGFGFLMGVFYMFFYGEDGLLVYFLKFFGVNVIIVNFNLKGMIFYEGKIFYYCEGWKYFGWKEKVRVMKLMVDIKRNKFLIGEEVEMSGCGWIKEKIGDNEFIDFFIKSFFGWVDSVLDVFVGELVREIKVVLKWGGFGFVRGGCKVLIDEFVRIVVENGGKILMGKKVVEVDVEVKKVVMVDNEEFFYDVFILNIGIKEIVEFFGRENFDREYFRYVEFLKLSEGIKYNVVLKGELRIGNIVVFIFDIERINGYNELIVLSLEFVLEGYIFIMFYYVF